MKNIVLISAIAFLGALAHGKEKISSIIVSIDPVQDLIDTQLPSVAKVMNLDRDLELLQEDGVDDAINEAIVKMDSAFAAADKKYDLTSLGYTKEWSLAKVEQGDYGINVTILIPSKYNQNGQAEEYTLIFASSDDHTDSGAYSYNVKTVKGFDPRGSKL
jgi:hypothetical protein